MKRAQSKIVGATFFQLDEAAYDLDDIDAAKYLLYGLLGDHPGKITLIRGNDAVVGQSVVFVENYRKICIKLSIFTYNKCPLFSLYN